MPVLPLDQLGSASHCEMHVLTAAEMHVLTAADAAQKAAKTCLPYEAQINRQIVVERSGHKYDGGLPKIKRIS